MTPLRKYLLACCIAILAWLPTSVSAQDALTLSVTPTLFEISVEPGQMWQSSIRVVNANPHDIEVFAQPVNFTATGETGVGQFAPLQESGGDGVTLGEWIEVSDDGVTVPAQETMSIPFRVDVPADAAPGGQFAALLISTQPPGEADSGSLVRTTQAVSSLFFMRIEGDIVEQGQIRSFRAAERFAQRPENTFELRFENQGTVHLQPQGDITIYNMWGERRGEIPINQRSQFGKVLPDTIRAFTFGWEGEFSLVDIGRYRAEVTLAHGEDNRAFSTATAYFWVIPVYGLLIVLGTLLVFGLLVAFLVRAYVRRVLALSGVEPGRRGPVQVGAGDINLSERSTRTEAADSDSAARWRVFAPVQAAWHDLATRWRDAPSLRVRCAALVDLAREYRLVMLGFIVLVLVLVIAAIFYQVVHTADRPFEVLLEDQADGVSVSSEELEYQRLREAGEQPAVPGVITDALTVGTSTPPLHIVNVSGEPGAAARVRLQLEQAGYEVAEISTDLNRTENRSVIVYDQAYQEEALQLSRALSGALLSARPVDALDGVPMVLYLGADVAKP